MHMTSKLAKLGLFDAMVPRYTSYPTAPQFKPETGSAQMERWIRAIPPGSQISLYLHIPFCRRLCWFCACRTQGTQTLSPVAGYLDTLIQEIEMLGHLLPEGVTLSRMHWGGGTPTLLSPPMIAELAQAVRQVAPLAERAEFSVEIDPNEIDSERVDALAAAGMNRASIGVQDFDPEVQNTIGRIQDFKVTQQAANMLRDVGITSLNADILYGLPHQTEARIADSVQKLLTLNPDRVALYGYAHVPWMARRQSMIPSDALPAPERRLNLFDTAARLFEWDGYRQIGIDHFAVPQDGLAIAAQSGQLRRNFQGYTDDPAEVLVGLGASAISRFPQGYAQNASATSAYAKAIQGARFATARGHSFAGEDLLRARLIEAVMCDFEVRFDDIAERFPHGVARVAELLQSAADHFGEMVQLADTGLRIRPQGRPLTRIIARFFDAYDMSGAGHASAI
ncbi:oxygen-independent coproporphyrinogen III oxidase [Roseobacter cerasinus]|uniref:Coproporphyrinogen-III oxidase n=1 Tax=Roseobacter cerasinus TaxID=2602289 RepID=A0A640VTI1_9RHOB|nr:oxygen-independent coproporphyrinogen III oxidase [Roseobacter cerasinus]GFE51137.1 oxygen-independent coproporphyrinogen III oxidase [Roseobacter cerasinus]